MTLYEFFGCGLLAFGPPLAMFSFTIASDPIRIIVMIAAAFGWLLSLLLSSMVWFALVPLREYLVFGLVFSIIFQELFRYGMYKLLNRAQDGLREIADIPLMDENKHMFAYVAGLGYGVMSGAFALVNVLADSVGPGTVGLKTGSDIFFITSSLLTLCVILLHTFWSVVFFNALDEKNYAKLSWVIGSHFVFSLLTLCNKKGLYLVSILPGYAILMFTVVMAYKTVGGNWSTFKRSLKLK